MKPGVCAFFSKHTPHSPDYLYSLKNLYGATLMVKDMVQIVLLPSINAHVSE